MSARATRAAAAALAAAAFVFYFCQFAGIGVDYWDTYIAAPATFIAGRPCVFTDDSGQPAYDYRLASRLPQDLVDRGAYGIVSRDQRLGAGVTFAAAYAVFGVLGFRLLHAACGAMIFASALLFGRRTLRGNVLPFVFAVLVAFNPFVFAMNRLNANFLGLAVVLGLFALLREERPPWLIAGLVYGALGGIRNEAVVLGPAALALVVGRPGWRRGLALFAVGALLAIAPYLYWNHFAFGQAIIHASQYGGFGGHRPVFSHQLLGWRFELNGLFNWPFHERLVRTPHYPFPTYLTLPLSLLRCFGTMLSGFALVGFFTGRPEDRRTKWSVVLWLVLWLGLFLFQENWEEPKNTFGALAVPPVALLAVRGVAWLADGRRFWPRYALVAGAVILLEVAVVAARSANAPVDERWYVRFPKAVADGASIGCLRDEQRREWMLFHSDECPPELAEQRAKLTRANLLPRLYYPLRLRAPSVRDEFARYEPRIFDIWVKIYGL